jgi:hypothetical protein
MGHTVMGQEAILVGRPRLDTPEYDNGPVPENHASDLGLWGWSG